LGSAGITKLPVGDGGHLLGVDEGWRGGLPNGGMFGVVFLHVLSSPGAGSASPSLLRPSEDVDEETEAISAVMAGDA